MSFSQAMNFRHACKIFDESKNISPENVKNILEFGRLSPSSFGLEPWKFLVVRDAQLRAKMKPLCWEQVQVTTGSFVVVYLNYLPSFFEKNSEFLRQRVARKQLKPETENFVLNTINQYIEKLPSVNEWTKKQVYIALANMMTGAASLGIDSCPLEGYDLQPMKNLLKEHVDWNVFDISVLCAFGYRIKEQQPRIREDYEKIVTVL